MNPNSQPDLHPDSDALSSFAEKALRGAERMRIIEHLAGCARCRQVVYLAQAAAEPEVAPAPQTNARLQPGWTSAAFAKWRVALIPAVALAAVAGIVVWMQWRPALPHTETAQMVAPPSPRPGSTAERSAPPPSELSPKPAVMPRPEQPSARAAKRARSEGLSPGAAGIEELAPRESADTTTDALQEQRFHGAIHLDGRSASMARYAPLPQAVSPQSRLSHASPNTAASWPSQNDMQVAPPSGGPAVAAPAPSSSVASAEPGQSRPAASAEGASQIALQSSEQIDFGPPSTNTLALMRIGPRFRLPSGLNSVSSAAVLSHLVAVDSAGSLFISQDGGTHWEPVPAQWSGKAVQVQAPPQHRLLSVGADQASVNDVPEESGNSESASPPPPAPAPAGTKANLKAAAPMLFKLVTDRHQTWVSADGKVWHEQ